MLLAGLPGQEVAALPSLGHLSIDVVTSFLQLLVSLTERSLPTPAENGRNSSAVLAWGREHQGKTKPM